MEDSERERTSIREACARLAAGEAFESAELEKLIFEMRRWLAGERSDCPDLAAVPPNFRPLINELAERRNRPLPPAAEMARDLRLIEWGTRVLALRAAGMEALAAMHSAHAESGADAISDTAIRAHHWNPFCELVRKRGFVPYFERCEANGTLAPTRFVPANLKAKPGRPRRK